MLEVRQEARRADDLYAEHCAIRKERRCGVSTQTIEELREEAAALSGALQLASQENATLKRQVESLVKNRAEMEDCWNCPVYTGSETLTCETREKCEEHIAKW